MHILKRVPNETYLLALPSDRKSKASVTDSGLVSKHSIAKTELSGRCSATDDADVAKKSTTPAHKITGA